MHLGRSGKAHRLAGETLDLGPQRHMCALELLRVPLALVMRSLIKVTRVGTHNHRCDSG